MKNQRREEMLGRERDWRRNGEVEEGGREDEVKGMRGCP